MRALNKWRKTLSLVIILTMIATVVPIGLVNTAFADVGDGNGYVNDFRYFQLDQSVKTALGTPVSDPYLPNQYGILGKTVFYKFNSNQLNLSGTTVSIQKPIYVKVEQMIKDGDNWKVVQQSGNTDLFYDPNNVHQFSGVINLRDGMNRLTLTGTDAVTGLGTKSDVLYVRYDSSIFLNSMTMLDGNDNVPLDGIVPSVAQNKTILVEIKATNATRISLGDREYSSIGNNTFLVGPITLSQGLNQLNFKIENSEGTEQTYTREVYLFDKNTLFVSGGFSFDAANPYKSAFNVIPKFPLDLNNPAINGKFSGEVLVPYIDGQDVSILASNLQQDLTALIPSDSNLPVTVLSNIKKLRGPNGLNYAILPVEIYPFIYQPLLDGTEVNLFVEADYFQDVHSSSKFTFQVQDSRKIYINGVSYLVNGLSTNQTPLSSTSTTTILLGDAVATKFKLDLSKPLGTTPINVEIPVSYGNPHITGIVDNTTSTPTITVEGLPGGEYIIRFIVADDIYEGKVRINNTPMIVFKNFSDGVTLDYTYIGDKTVEIELPNVKLGDIIGKSTLFVNGSEVLTMADGVVVQDGTLYLVGNQVVINGTDTSNPIGTITEENNTTTIVIDKVSLRRGENSFEYTMYLNNHQVSKRTISFYIDDTRTPRVTEFKPVLIPTYRAPLTNPDAWADSDGISYSKQTGIHVTNEKKFDLIIQAYQVKQFELTMDGVTVLNYTDSYPDRDDKTGISLNNPYDLDYDLDKSNQQRLTIRIENLNFYDKEIHTFNLKLMNSNGSMINMPMEFRREVAPYLILSPVPTVGKDIIVNKNYVPIYIRAEDADEVIIGKEKAVYDKENDWYAYDFIGLKENKWNDIKFEVVRGTETIEGEINVYYANMNQDGAANLVPMENKVDALNDLVNLEFPKGTILRTREFINERKPLYEGHNLLIGIADLSNGLVDKTDYKGDNITTVSGLRTRFNSLPDTFVPVSPMVYIHGGLAEYEDEYGKVYPPIKNGLQPYDRDSNKQYYSFTDQRNNDRMLEPSQRGEITITFDPAIRNSASSVVTVFRLTQDGKWENLGGVVKKNEITVPFDDFGYYVVMKWRGSFEDISNHPWARNILEVMYAKGFMNGKLKDVDFGTIDPVSRGEFAQLLVKALQIKPIDDNDGTPTFLDVRPSYTGRVGSMPHEGPVWEYKYIEAAARAGIVRGYTSNLFLPNRSLTREEAAVMVANALNLKLAKNDDKLYNALQKLYKDAHKTHFYSRPSVLAVNKAKIMEGSVITSEVEAKKPEFNFYPTNTLTRAEAATIIVRLMQNHLKILPKDIDTTNPNGQF